jgi:hypothetical protein
LFEKNNVFVMTFLYCTSTVLIRVIYHNCCIFLYLADRLGPKKPAKLVKKLASPVGVFGRLGKQLSSLA